MSDLIQGHYVVGMSWASIVAQGDTGKLARMKAAKERGNWYAHATGQNNVGVAVLRKKLKPAKGEHFFSAARIVAALSPYGPHFYALRLPADGEHSGKVWICAVNEGLPVSLYDEIVTDIEAPQRFEAFLQARGISAGECGIHGDVSGVSVGINPLGWNEAMRVPDGGAFARLQPTTMSFIEGLTPAQKLAIGVVIALVAANEGWGEYKKWRARKEAALAAAQQLDPAVEWQRTLDTWQATKWAPGNEPLVVLRRAMGLVPVDIEGWALDGFQCGLAAAGWTCVGSYDRKGNLERDPSTGDFLRARPQAWIVNPKSLDQIEVNFSIPMQMPTLEIAKLHEVDWHMRNSTTTLQKAFRAFTNMSLSDFSLVPLAAPVRADGGAIEEPAGLVKPKVASVIVSGPMRSLDLREIEQLPVSWNSMQIRISTKTDKPDLKLSAVTMEAKGEIYAK